MSRISRNALVRAITAVRQMDFKQKEQLADELHRAQPHVFGTFLVQARLGVSLPKMQFLLELLLVGFQAMRESGLAWPLITEDELERQMDRLVARVKFDGGLTKTLRSGRMRQYVAAHPEKELLAYVHAETANWLGRIVPEETDKYIMLAASNFVNCIAYVPMPAAAPTTCTEETRA